ncbi:hypothetical protein FRC03_012309 [Tulasnella sp. 419]|nr:hypothetical protein FRC03_012309 [Tulasnella sp. 419]
MISRFLLAGRGKITTKPLLSCASNLSRKDNIALSLSWRTIHTTHLRQLEHNEKPVAGPTQPPTSPSNNLKRPVSSTNSEHTKKPSQKPETEEGEEYQTPIPAPLNIPGAGVPGFGLSFRSGASFDAALTTVVGLALVFLGELIDALINGTEQGYYYLIMGSKGTGKQTMILDAMRKINAEGVAIVEAHSDLEVFRLRLGKAINFEFNEDSQTGLFQRRDPREGEEQLQS